MATFDPDELERLEQVRVLAKDLDLKNVGG